MLSEKTQRAVEQLLLLNNIVTKENLESMNIEAAKANKPLVDLLVDRKVIKPDDAVQIIAAASGSKYVNLSKVNISDEILGLIPKSIK